MNNESVLQLVGKNQTVTHLWNRPSSQLPTPSSLSSSLMTLSSSHMPWSFLPFFDGEGGDRFLPIEVEKGRTLGSMAMLTSILSSSLGKTWKRMTLSRHRGTGIWVCYVSSALKHTLS